MTLPIELESLIFAYTITEKDIHSFIQPEHGPGILIALGIPLKIPKDKIPEALSLLPLSNLDILFLSAEKGFLPLIRDYLKLSDHLKDSDLISELTDDILGYLQLTELHENQNAIIFTDEYSEVPKSVSDLLEDLLKLSTTGGHLEIIQYLIENFPTLDYYYFTLPRVAVSNNHLHIVSYFAGKKMLHPTFYLNGLPKTREMAELLCSLMREEKFVPTKENLRFFFQYYNAEKKQKEEKQAVEYIDIYLRYFAEISPGVISDVLPFFIREKNLNIFSLLYRTLEDLPFFDLSRKVKTFHYAIQMESQEISAFLRERSSEGVYREVILKACRYDQLDIVKYFDDDPNLLHFAHDLPLCRASGYGSKNIVEFLVERKGDLHTRVEEPLIRAVSYEHLDVVKYLLEQKADPLARNQDPLRIAAMHGNEEIVRSLMSSIPSDQNISEDILALSLQRGEGGMNYLLKRQNIRYLASSLTGYIRSFLG